MSQLKEWKDQWNNGDVKFVPELFELADGLQQEVWEVNDLNEYLGDKVNQYKDKLSQMDSATIKTYQKATERINGLEKRIQELESEIIVLKIINNSI